MLILWHCCLLHSNELFCVFSGLSPSLLGRLKLTSAKLQTLAEGIRSIATQDEPIHKVDTIYCNLQCDVYNVCYV